MTVSGGAAGRLLLSTDHLPLGHPQAHGLLTGVLEPSVQEALRRHVGPGATVFDIGADIGFFSILSARLAGSRGRVEAFEPVPASAAAISANARLNGFGDRVTVHETAVSDREGRASFLVGADPTWSHLSDRGEDARATARLEVPVIALDERIGGGELPIPHVVKLDVEGSEIAVLTGLSRTLDAHRPVVICELHETNREIVELLTAHGYTVENLDGTAPVLEAGAVHILGRPPSGSATIR